MPERRRRLTGRGRGPFEIPATGVIAAVVAILESG